MIPTNIFPSYATIMVVLALACIGVIALITWTFEFVMYLMEHLQWNP